MKVEDDVKMEPEPSSDENEPTERPDRVFASEPTGPKLLPPAKGTISTGPQIKVANDSLTSQSNLSLLSKSGKSAMEKAAEEAAPGVEPASDLFADIFQNEKDLKALDSIVSVARQPALVDNEEDEPLVGVMSDSDEDASSSSSGVIEVVPVSSAVSEEVGIMSSSDESSRDEEIAEEEGGGGDIRKNVESTLGGNYYSI